MAELQGFEVIHLGHERQWIDREYDCAQHQGKTSTTRKSYQFSFPLFAVKSQRIQAMLEDGQWVSPVRHGFAEPVFSLGPLRINWLVVLYLITSNMFFPSLINY